VDGWWGDAFWQARNFKEARPRTTTSASVSIINASCNTFLESLSILLFSSDDFHLIQVTSLARNLFMQCHVTVMSVSRVRSNLASQLQKPELTTFISSSRYNNISVRISSTSPSDERFSFDLIIWRP
jgi:hypothetical protein